MVSCWNNPPNTFLTSVLDSVWVAFGLGTSFGFGFGFGFKEVDFLTKALWAGRDRALACPLAVATCTLDSTLDSLTAGFSWELSFSQDSPELKSLALFKRLSTEAPAAAAALSWASFATVAAAAFCSSSLFNSCSRFFDASAASRAFSVALVASSCSLAFARASA